MSYIKQINEKLTRALIANELHKKIPLLEVRVTKNKKIKINFWEYTPPAGRPQIAPPVGV